MYGRKAMGAADCVPGVWPRLRIAGPLYASSELAGAASSCAESDCAIRPIAHPKNRAVRTKSKAVLLDWKCKLYSDALEGAVSSAGGVRWALGRSLGNLLAQVGQGLRRGRVN